MMEINENLLNTIDLHEFNEFSLISINCLQFSSLYFVNALEMPVPTAATAQK